MNRVILTAAAIALVTGAPLDAQIRASERGVVSQTADGTTVTVEYSRPAARGRELFGDLVPWGVVWTPGANWATTLEADHDIRINGVAVPAGKYSVWAIPREDAWSIVLNENPRIFHFQKPDSASSAYAIGATPESADHLEMLTWSFPVVRGDAMVLRLHWGATAVPLNISVPATVPDIAAEERARYVGTYELAINPGLPWPAEPATFEVFEEEGKLRGRLPFGIHPQDDHAFDLVPAGSDRFGPGLYRDGEFFAVESGVAFEFTMEGERATSVTMRGGEGSEFGAGDRVN
jgi:hypothetical protein